MHERGAVAEPRILLSTQSLVSGNGGICAVARMTAAALSRRYPVRALACEDEANYAVGPVEVLSFGGSRVSFVRCNFFEAQRATHVIYDFAGTARSHCNLPFLRRPYALWVHGWEIWQGARPKYLRAIAGASLILANSDYTIARSGKSVPAGVEVRICELGTPPDSALVAPSDLGGPPVVMLLGRIDDLFAKGHDILIDVWPQVVSAVADARLVFVGGGDAVERARALAAASPVREMIEIAGFVPDAALETYWRRATIFAMLGYAEGFGLVYADAMRHGLPVIASREDGGQEVNVDGVTGFNIPRSDTRRLTEVLITLLRDRDYASKLGSAGYARWQERYSFDVFSERLLAATESFLSR